MFSGMLGSRAVSACRASASVSVSASSSARIACGSSASRARSFVSRADDKDYTQGPISPWDRLKSFFLYYPDGDTQSQPASSTEEAPKVNRAPPTIKAQVPTVVDEDTLYDIQYYTRDMTVGSARKGVRETDSPLANLLPAPDSVESLGSPGNNNEAVLAYDATGTRSAMSTTYEEVTKMVRSKYPTHLPVSVATKAGTPSYDSFKAELEKPIPAPIGVRSKWSGARVIEPLNSSFE